MLVLDPNPVAIPRPTDEARSRTGGELVALSGLQLQGDIAVVPSPDAHRFAGPLGGATRVPELWDGESAGVPVVTGELSVYSHWLVADGGGVRWRPPARTT